MKKPSKFLAAFAIVLALASFSSKFSFADDDDDNGFLSGLIAALLTSETIESSNPEYNDATLKVQAAAYLDTRAEGALFSSIVNQVAIQQGIPVDQVDKSTLSTVILSQ